MTEVEIGVEGQSVTQSGVAGARDHLIALLEETLDLAVVRNAGETADRDIQIAFAKLLERLDGAARKT